MGASLTLKGAFALLLALSVGGKVFVAHQVADQPLHDFNSAGERGAEADAVAAFLGRHGFRVGEVRGMAEPPSVQATASACELLALLVTPEGTNRDLIRHLAPVRDRVSFVYNGTIYSDQPAWLTWTHYQWRIQNARFGRRLPTRPVLALITSPGCNLRGLPWGEIAELS